VRERRRERDGYFSIPLNRNYSKHEISPWHNVLHNVDQFWDQINAYIVKINKVNKIKQTVFLIIYNYSSCECFETKYLHVKNSKIENINKY
jgi:hypothetical protein